MFNLIPDEQSWMFESVTYIPFPLCVTSVQHFHCEAAAVPNVQFASAVKYLPPF